MINKDRGEEREVINKDRGEERRGEEREVS